MIVTSLFPDMAGNILFLTGASDFLVSGLLWLITAFIDVMRFLLCTTHCLGIATTEVNEADTGQVLREFAMSRGGKEAEKQVKRQPRVMSDSGN